MSAESLAAAEHEVDERIQAGTCTAPTLAVHPKAVMGLAEFYAERDKPQEEAAQPAA